MPYSKGVYTPIQVPLNESQTKNYKLDQTAYAKDPGILSVEADAVGFDPLKADSKKGEYDPVSKGASRRVATKYKDYGLALLPEQAAALNEELAAYKDQDTRALTALQQYRSQFAQNVEQRDNSMGGQIEGARKAIEDAVSKITAPSININTPEAKSGIPMATIRIVRGGVIESVHELPQAVADALAREKGLYTSQTPEGFNVDVRGKGGHIVGQELHEAMNQADIDFREAMSNRQQQINDAVSQARSQAEAQARAAVEAAKEQTRAIQYNLLDRSIATSNTERNIAVYDADREFVEGMKRYRAIGEQWSKRLSDMRLAADKASAINTAGIKSLGRSGILNYSTSRG